MKYRSPGNVLLCCAGFILFILFLPHPDFTAKAEGQNSFILSEPAEKTAEPFKISISAQPDILAAGSTSGIQVIFDIAAGYKLYADATSVRPHGREGFTFGKVKTPRPVRKKEPDGKTALFYEGLTVFELPVRSSPALEPSEISLSLEILLRGCSETVCFLPEKREKKIVLTLLPPISEEIKAGVPEKDSLTAVELRENDKNVEYGEGGENPFRNAASEYGLTGVLLAAFLWGLLASLTPCVYPMIPVTVSVIGAGPGKNLSQSFLLSLFYVLGMSLTYAIFGVIAAWSGSLFGAYTDHPLVRIGVAVLFFILALGMFDLLHIRMPSRIASGLGTWTGSGRFGVFFTGAATGAVVGPCVGPMLAGLLIYIAALGSKIQGFFIMWSFALGMGVLFLIIGTFSGAASALPQAGPWMEKIRRFFGLLMLGVALYYIRPLLPPSFFYLMLGAILIGTGIYSGAADRLAPESGGYARFQKSIAILCLTLGIAYAVRFAMWDILLPQAGIPAAEREEMQWIGSEAAGLRMAGEQQKPVMMDFRADWCSACLKLEQKTFRDARVQNLAESFILLRIDNTDTKDPVAEKLRKKYGIVGLPTIIFLDASGKILHNLTITEYVGPEELISRMETVVSAQ